MRVLLWHGRMGRVRGCYRRFAGCVTYLLLGIDSEAEEGVWFVIYSDGRF